jgi:hypothetical protein
LTGKIKTSLGYIKQYFSAQQKVQIKAEETKNTAVNPEHTVSQSDEVFKIMFEISQSKK